MQYECSSRCSMYTKHTYKTYSTLLRILVTRADFLKCLKRNAYMLTGWLPRICYANQYMNKNVNKIEAPQTICANK